MIKDNPLIERIRSVRHQISEENHHDPRQLVEHYIELEKKHQGRFIDLAEIQREREKHEHLETPNDDKELSKANLSK